MLLAHLFSIPHSKRCKVSIKYYFELLLSYRFYNKPRLKGKDCSDSIAEHRVSELIPVLGNQPAGDVSHKPGGRLPLLSAIGPQLPSQRLRGLLPVSLLGE